MVGDNESGKSTIIEALDILINKTYENFDRYILGELFNSSLLAKFKDNPTFENLPKIIICAEFELDANEKNSKDYYGINWYNSDKKTSKYGILFECLVENDMKADVADIISKNVLPFEYYTLRWTTFKNETYNKLKKAIFFVPIDASNNTSFNSLDYYSKRLFIKKHEDKMSLVKTDFRGFLDKSFSNLKIEALDNSKKFGLNHKKLILENIIGILDDEILIENRGKGLEKMIKTELALEIKSNIDVIAIEEPENNLSHTNLRKMIHNIQSNYSEKQLIITTHNSLIATGLSLKNVIWVSDRINKTLTDLKEDTADYFMKLENDNLLRFILANKVILVEGATEQLIVPYLFEKEHELEKRTIEIEGIDIISCNGLSYKKYLEIAATLNKKVAVMTDNDGSEVKVKEFRDYNNSNTITKIFSPSTIDDYTWEVSLKKVNQSLIDNLVNIQDGAKYKVKGIEFDDKRLAFMLLNKVDFSMKLIESKQKINIPRYLKELFEWIKE